MWFPKFILLISVFGYIESYAGPKNYDAKVYRHVIEVSDATLPEDPTTTGTEDEELMVARGSEITFSAM